MEYGEAMQVYAEVAGLRRRIIIAIPFLTPTIASLWIGLVTPMPPGLARPLIESLEVDAVADEHDIDAVIPRAGGGSHRLPRGRGERVGKRSVAQRPALGARGREQGTSRHGEPSGRLSAETLSLSVWIGMPLRAAVASMCSMTFLPNAVSPGSSIG